MKAVRFSYATKSESLDIVIVNVNHNLGSVTGWNNSND